MYSLVLEDVGQPSVPSTLRALTPIAPTAGDGVRVALLYRRFAQPDDHLLQILEDRLTETGHSVFIDRHITIGIEWAREIESQIRSSEVVIPLLSATSVHSEMLEYELKVANDAAQEGDGRPRILPVRVDFDDPLPRLWGRYWTLYSSSIGPGPRTMIGWWGRSVSLFEAPYGPRQRTENSYRLRWVGRCR